MKVFLVLISLSFCFNLTAETEANVMGPYLQTCMGYRSSPYSFESCMNSNFSRIRTHYNLFLSSCYGTPNDLYGLASCANRNFDRVGSHLRIYLSYCSTPDAYPESFENCIRSNFSKIQNTAD